MSSHYVYVIVNKINLKLYFGSHSWDGEGLDKNYYGSGKIIKRAVEKYGKDNFIVYPIKFYDTVEECRKAEEELLTKYDISNNPYCYNIKNGAVGWTSEDVKGKNNPMYGKRGKDAPWYGKHLSEEHRKNLSQALKGRTFSEEHRKNLVQARKGRTLSEKQKEALLQARNYKKIPIVAIQIATGKIKIFESQRECSRVLGVHRGSIYSCLKGIQKTCKGYTFKYLEQLESGIYEGITGIAE